MTNRRRNSLVDAETAAVAYNCTARTIRRWIKEGRLTNHGTPRHAAIDVHERLRDRATDVPYLVSRSDT